MEMLTHLLESGVPAKHLSRLCFLLAFPISQADQLVNPESLAYEIRALAASAAFPQSVSLSSLLEAAFWKSTFILMQACIHRDLACRKCEGSFGFLSLVTSSLLAP